jgi:predicted metal-binding protein
MSTVYQYYEEAIITNELNPKTNQLEQVTKFVCKLCKKSNKKDKYGEEFKVTVYGKSTSNLLSHLQIKLTVLR